MITELKDEKNQLGEYGTSDQDEKATSREVPLPYDGFRTQFERDYTRILHSRAFRRMRHKTQVFIRPENDHICTRLEHSLYLASIA
jgi:dGTPase